MAKIFRFSRRGTLITAVAAVLLAAGALKIFVFPSEAPAQVASSVTRAAVVKPTRQDLTSVMVLSAEFRPYQEADLHAKIAGYLDDINVDIGDQVKTGDVLAKLDPAELTADLDHAQASYDNEKLEYDRLSEVVKKQPGLVAQEQVDKAKAAYQMAKASLERAQTLVNYATITAPFDGVITKRYVDPGALVQASGNSSTQTLPVVHLAENSRLRLDFPVPEYAVPKVSQGTPVEITVQATHQVIQSRVARVAGDIDPNTRTMEAEVDVDNKDLRLTPGMYAAVKIELERKPQALALPIQAVSLGDQPNVWVVDQGGDIQERPVKLGLETADRVEVVTGVEEGDLVVFGNRGRLSPGMKVKPELVSPDSATKPATS